MQLMAFCVRLCVTDDTDFPSVQISLLSVFLVIVGSYGRKYPQARECIPGL